MIRKRLPLPFTLAEKDQVDDDDDNDADGERDEEEAVEEREINEGKSFRNNSGIKERMKWKSSAGWQLSKEPRQLGFSLINIKSTSLFFKVWWSF